MFSENGTGSSFLDSTDKVFFIGLPLVEVGVTLVPTIDDGRFVLVDDLVNERTLTLFAVGQKDTPGNAPVDIETDMGLGLLGTPSIIGPLHGQDGVDQRTVYGDQVAKVRILGGNYIGRFLDKIVEYLAQLIKAAGVDGLEKSALFDSLGGGNTGFGKIVLLQGLEQFPAR
jgi:hypothetical protein